MIEISQIENLNAIGIKVSMPGAPPLILIRGTRGALFCGYLNTEVAERLGLAAAIVGGVKNFEEMLEKPVTYSTRKAIELGVKPGMSGRDALNLLI
ncbi:MAG: YunC family protein [Candidatus Methanomethyliales bacterium]|nr:YunC family protein [Candidatus Methanomethylicales archaeon]